MALIKTLKNNRNEDVSYWKIIRVVTEVIEDSTRVILYGFIDRDDRQEFLTVPKDTKEFTFSPKTETFSDIYTLIKNTEEFIDAVDLL